MALQIEAPETIRLVEELARRTGEGAETVVQVALQERLARLRTPEEEAERRARVYALVKSFPLRSRNRGYLLKTPMSCSMGKTACPGDRRLLGAHRDPQ
jgi:hypothetical protein